MPYMTLETLQTSSGALQRARRSSIGPTKAAAAATRPVLYSKLPVLLASLLLQA
jgi:hypothetical protein